MNPVLQSLQQQSLKGKKLHFIGIGGIGMSALARYFLSFGSAISGSDRETSQTLSELKKVGIENIWTPHNKENIKKINPDYVIYSTAINQKENEEFLWAKENKKIILHRSDLLEFAVNQKKLISISGTHGKTTTSAMVTEILLNNNLNPSAIIGGTVLSKKTNTIYGEGEYFVTEADESDKSFLKGNPEIAVITNIEADHLENYPGGFEEIKNSFIEFAKKSLSKTALIACIQDKVTNEIITNNFNLPDKKLITYGTYEKCPQAVLYSKYNLSKKSFDIYFKGEYKTSIQLKLLGEHNLLNALAAFAVGLLLGLGPEKIKTSLENYSGVQRRFQFLVKNKEITIIDDYAHHPTEISVTINAAKQLNPKRLIVVLQPHQPSRLRDLWKEYIQILKSEDTLVFITDVYIARGSEIKGISSEKLAGEINKSNINYISGNIDDIAQTIQKYIKEGDLILIMVAGDITNLGPKLLKLHKVLA